MNDQAMYQPYGWMLKKTLSAFTRVEWGVQAAAQTGVQAAETGDNQQNRCLINRSKGLLKIGQAK